MAADPNRKEAGALGLRGRFARKQPQGRSFRLYVFRHGTSSP